MTDETSNHNKPMTHEERLKLIMKPIIFNIISSKLSVNRGYRHYGFEDMAYEARVNKLKT